ncbi:LacI family transcriptional regulator [Burkholderia seminalis]|nr:LacI family transcriptional regulator [Burkholderia seminalis]
MPGLAGQSPDNRGVKIVTGRADLWLAQQSAYDPWRARGAPKVARAQART